MQNGSRAFAKSAAVGLALLAPLALGNTSPARQSVIVSVTDMRSTSGTVLACLTSRPDAFPDCSDDDSAKRRIVRANSRMVIVFTDVQPGRYAVSLLHDENGNGKVDKTLFIPKEGFGFSRDAKLRMGPPPFSAAAFDVPADSAVHQTIRMRYLAR